MMNALNRLRKYRFRLIEKETGVKSGSFEESDDQVPDFDLLGS